MKKILIIILSLSFTAVILSGCASDNLKAPCPDYGRYCHKTPINSWNYPSD